MTTANVGDFLKNVWATADEVVENEVRTGSDESMWTAQVVDVLAVKSAFIEKEWIELLVADAPREFGPWLKRRMLESGFDVKIRFEVDERVSSE